MYVCMSEALPPQAYVCMPEDPEHVCVSMYVCLTGPSKLVCMSEAPEQVCMYVSLKAIKSACFGGCQNPYQKPSKSNV